MLFEASSEFVRGRSFGHLWKRLEQLILCAKQVFQFVHIQFFKLSFGMFPPRNEFRSLGQGPRGGPASPLKMRGSEPRSRPPRSSSSLHSIDQATSRTRALSPFSEAASPVEETSWAPVRSRISLAFFVH